MKLEQHNSAIIVWDKDKRIAVLVKDKDLWRGVLGDDTFTSPTLQEALEYVEKQINSAQSATQ